MNFKVGQVWRKRSGSLVAIIAIDYKVCGELYKRPIRAMDLASGLQWSYGLNGEASERHPRYDLTILVSDLVEDIK